RRQLVPPPEVVVQPGRLRLRPSEARGDTAALSERDALGIQLEGFCRAVDFPLQTALVDHRRRRKGITRLERQADRFLSVVETISQPEEEAGPAPELKRP